MTYWADLVSMKYRMEQMYEPMEKKYGLGIVELHILMLICYKDNQSTAALMHELNIRYLSGRGGFSAYIDKLVKEGYVQRIENPHSKRSKSICATQKIKDMRFDFLLEFWQADQLCLNVFLARFNHSGGYPNAYERS